MIWERSSHLDINFIDVDFEDNLFIRSQQTNTLLSSVDGSVKHSFTLTNPSYTYDIEGFIPNESAILIRFPKASWY